MVKTISISDTSYQRNECIGFWEKQVECNVEALVYTGSKCSFRQITHDMQADLWLWQLCVCDPYLQEGKRT